MLWQGPDLRDTLLVSSSACSHIKCSWGRDDRDGETQIIVFVPSPPPPGTHEVSLTLPDGRILVAALPLATTTPPPVAQPSPTPDLVAAPSPPGTRAPASPSPAAVGQYRITGTVTSRSSGGPIQNATVNFGGGYYSAVTDPSGMYGVSVPSGTYSVRFEPPSGSRFVPQYWKNALHVKTSTPVVVKDADVLGVNAALDTGWFVSGTVTNATTGAAVEGVLVAGTSTAGDFVVGTGVARSDVSGRFRLTVAEGTFRVNFSPPVASRLLRQWWRSAASSSGATLLTVSGADIADIDAALARGSAISGSVVSAATGTRPATNVIVCPSLASSESIFSADLPCEGLDPSGGYAVSVPAGTYRMGFDCGLGADGKQQCRQWWKGAASFAAATDIVVRSDVTGIDASLPAKP